MRNYQITNWCHQMAAEHISEGDICIDATMGNGNDTEFLCRLVGKNGNVIAFDIQQAALDHTRERLETKIEHQNYELHLESHEMMGAYAKEDSVSCIMFNLGYLPTGDHTLATKGESSIRAMETGLKLLKKNGVMSICIYSGGDSGFEERDAVLAWLKTLDSKKYLVLLTQYYNRPNNPPIPALVVRIK